jgi:hypothetical protein
MTGTPYQLGGTDLIDGVHAASQVHATLVD